MTTRIKHFSISLLCVLAFMSGCSNNPTPSETLPPRDNTPQIYLPEASGTLVHGNNTVFLDCSNLSKGYLMLSYLGQNEKVQFQVKLPDGTTYSYVVTDCTTPTAFPLTGGNGTYTLSLYESVDAKRNRYALTFTQEILVEIEDEFLPFLTPNIYVNFTGDSLCVSKGIELTKTCHNDLESIENIYYYVIRNIIYDDEKAKDIPYGYIPSPDATLQEGTGICFDYASLMTALLRSQRIPTKLEVGYAGEIYHAWISCYVEEIGWVDNIIEFDGKNWSLLDPTLAASNDREDVQEYIGDGSTYLIKYTY